jgi:two-component system sensor histidine kinase TctE
MFWKKTRRLTLKAKVLALLLPGMAGILAVELWLTNADALEAANAAYDRSLLGAIRSLDLNVSTASGGLAVELPYRLFEFFQLTAAGDVFFRVATADGLVEIGSPDLPKPAEQPPLGTPVFYDATYFGESVRVGTYVRALEKPLSAGGVQQLVIQVAENVESRRQFTRSFVLRAAVRDGSLIAAIGLMLAGLMALALRPLSKLAAQVAQRKASDLRPLQAEDLPGDIQPLVEAVNRQVARTREVLSRERAFLDDASHQLRTPLATLRAQIDYGLREPDPEKVQFALRALSEQLDDAVRSTNQLLAMARTDAAALRTEPIDLEALVKEVAVKLLPQARLKELDFGVHLPQSPCVAEGDPVLLREAFSNLAHNAISYTPPRGEVTLAAAADALGFSLSVHDSGPGVAEDVLARIGERFVKGRGSNGAGLGLAIAKTIAERHGGSLRLHADENRAGWVAYLWWPRLRA